MFDRFSEGGRKVMSLARTEAHRLRHDYIGTEHMLVALAAAGGEAAQALAAVGAATERLRDAVERVVSRGTATAGGQLPFTPDSKAALEGALETADSLNHGWIGDEHLLLGVLSVEDGTARDVLAAMSIATEALRDDVLRRLAGGGPPTPETAPLPSERQLEPTPAAAALLRRSVDETRKAQHRFAGTEHLLLAALAQGGDLAAAFESRDVTEDGVRREIARLRGPTEEGQAPSRPPFTPRAVRALDRAGEESRKSRRTQVAARDIASAVLSIEDGLAFTIVRALGADPDALRAAIRRLPVS